MKSDFVLNEIYDMITKINNKLLDVWLSTIVFSWRWWLQIALTLIPFLLWIVYHDKNRTGRLLFVGLVAAISTNMLDIIGLSYGLWHYDWKLLPLTVSYIPWDLALFPVSVMSLLQFRPKINALLKAVIFAFACAFVFEPLFVWLKMYHVTHWKYYYSFFIYIILFLFYHKIYNSSFIGDLR